MSKKQEIRELTKAEEDVMQIVWKLDKALVSDILEIIQNTLGKRPPHSTISSIVRILEQKGFVGHKAYGRTYEYFPLITKQQYGKRSLGKLLTEYFGGSSKQLVSFLVSERDLDLKSLIELTEEIEENPQND